MSGNRKRGGSRGGASFSGFYDRPQSPAQQSSPIPHRPAEQGNSPAGESKKQTGVSSERKDKNSAQASGSGTKTGGPEKKKELSPLDQLAKKVELPSDAFPVPDGMKPEYLGRPRGVTPGTSITNDTRMNVFRVKKYGEHKSIHQYDISVLQGKDKKPMNDPDHPPPRGLVKKLWEHENVQGRIKPLKTTIHWLFNGYNIAWSTPKMKNDREDIQVDLDPGSERDHVFTLVVKHKKVMDLSPLRFYLERRAAFTNGVIETLTFLDHALRHGPSATHQSIGKSLHKRVTEAEATNGRPRTVYKIGDYLELIKGSFASFRISSIPNEPKGGLVVNLDVANAAFWKPLMLLETIAWMTGNPTGQYLSILEPYRVTATLHQLSAAASPHLRRLIGLKFKVYFTDRQGNQQAQSTIVHTIRRFHFDVENGETANITFKKTIKGVEQDVSVSDHFYQKYRYKVENTKYVLVETMKNDYFPLEVCKLEPVQKVRYKLNPAQTSAMIDNSVTFPDRRHADIQFAVNELNWGEDETLTAFGIDIDTAMMKASPHDLNKTNEPKIHYKGKCCLPVTGPNGGANAASNLMGKKFLVPQWPKKIAFVNLLRENLCSESDERQIWGSIKGAYHDHTDGWLRDPTFKRFSRITEWNKKETYDLVFVLLRENNTDMYNEVKKFLDCTVKVPSQVLVYFGQGKAKFRKGVKNAYWSNLCLKINAKMGGTAFVSSPTTDQNGAKFTVPTMVIGLDVSHAAPGSDQQSMAAMSVSLDRNAAYYGGSCQANGPRNEILEPGVMRDLLQDHLRHWKTLMKLPNGAEVVPKDLYFFRDGVSDRQFQQVLDKEVKAIREVFKENQCGSPNITVIVATKRHHIRAFMDGGKRNPIMNPEPGTLVEDLATHPQHWEFFLYSHRAIKGTSRPVHYHVLKNETGCTRQSLPNLIYRQCYQYCRCPTPVSLHPAIYYAHLISKRAVNHLSNDPPDADGRLRVVPIPNLQERMWFA